MTLSDWLAAHGLAAIAPALEAHDVDLDVLRELSEADLKEIGLTLGQRRRLQKALRDESTETPPLSTDTSANKIPTQADTGAERRHVSVMFVDLVGSTALAGRTDPEEMAALIARFQDAVSGAIGRYGGHIAKFMGDGVLAYFGWPRVREDEMEMALRAGLQALDAITKLAAPDGAALTARAGIASGWVVVGDLIGHQEARERTIVGDTPNLAARLQSAAKPGELIVSDSTRRLAGDQFRYEALPTLQLRGYNEPITAYRVLGEAASASRFEARTTKAQRRPLVGRDTELSLLMNAWRMAVSGEGQGVVLVGEAGIGKSRLTSELLSRAWEVEHRRLRFQCSPFFADTPLWPVAQQLRRAAGIDEFGNDGRSGAAPEAANARSVDGERPTAIDRLRALVALGGTKAEFALPALADLVGLRADDSDVFLALPATRQRMLAQSALIEQVLGLASKQPILMVLEDAHWADPSTLELFELLLEAVGDARVMVLITSRPDDEPRFAPSNVTRLSLSRLGRSAVSTLIDNVMANAPHEVVEEITARTDGVPLFVEELTKAVMEARDEPAGGDSPIPASLHDSLMARLDRLHGVREVAQIAACIGREFDRNLLLSASGFNDEAIDDALDKLLDAELIFRSGRAEERAFVFKHALVRDAAYVSLLRSRRQTIHAAIVTTLDRLHDSAPSLIGHHAAEAGDVQRAVAAFTQAGQEAARQSANDEAVSAFHRALGLVSELPEETRDVRKLELQVDLSVPLIAVRGYAAPEVEALLTDALAMAERAGDIAQIFKVTRGLWNCIFDKGEVQKSHELSKELVDMAEHARRGDWLRLAYRAHGSNLMNEGRFIEARQALQTVMNTKEPWSPDETLFNHGEDPVSVTRWYLAWIDTIVGDVEAGRARIDAAVHDAQALALPIASVFARSIRNSILYLLRDARACHENAETALKICEEYGFPFWSASHELSLGWARVLLGEGEVALDQARSGVEAWKATGAGLHVCNFNCYVADAALHLGCTEIAALVIKEADEVVRRTGEVFMHSEMLRLKSRFLQAEGDIGAAVSALRESLAIAKQQGAGLLRLRAARDLARLQIELDKSEHDGLAALSEAVNALPNPQADAADFAEARELLQRNE